MIDSSRARRQLLKVLTGLLLLATPATGSAQVVYGNGAPDNSGGVPVGTQWTTANDFNLLQTTELGWFDWYALFPGANGPSTAKANFFWQILADNGGRPGDLLTAGSVTGGTGYRTNFGCCEPRPWEYEAYRFSTSLGATTLGAGTYWLAIGGFTSIYSRAEYFWANSVGGYGNESKRWEDGDWRTKPNEGAFTIYGRNDVNVVPEPATLALLATGISGLGGVGLMRRRKKAS